MGVDPASIAIASTILGGIGTGVQMLGSIQQGKAQQASANYNAAVAANNAEIAKQNAARAAAAGDQQAAMQQQKTKATVGAIKSAQAANGISVDSGSAVDVRSSAAELGQLDAVTIRSNAARTAYGYQADAASQTSQSQLDKYQADSAGAAGYVNAGSSLLGGLSSAASSYNKFNRDNSDF